ncbi:MAG: ABC transporter ATP-binding protein [Clostridiales bacterium]|nr:ABC transporter ATP-binding protein [Clostridiales bacterium]
MEYIILEDVSKILKNRKVLQEINLVLIKCLTYGFIGRNGSGKTMILRAISGLITPTTGKITVFGINITEKHCFPDKMGLIIEDIELWNDLTGFQNLQLIADINKTITNDEIRSSLTRVGLDPDDKRKYRAYSMGMKKRLNIAQAIMEKPDLILLDEPTNGLDEQGVSLFQLIAKEEKSRGATLFIATHLKEDIRDLCDEVYVMDNGFCRKSQEGLR